MKIIRIFLLAVICIASTAVISNAQIKGSTMGLLQTVGSDGVFDVSRNPALLTQYNSNIMLGAFISGLPYYDYKTSVESSDNDVAVDFKKPSILNIGGNISYAMRIGGYIIGIAISNADKDLYMKKKSETIISLGSNTRQVTDNLEETDPSIYLSMAIPVSKSSAIGLQLLTQYSYINTSSKADLHYSQYFTADIKSVSHSISSELALGYHYKADNTQIGIYVKSGKSVFEKESIDSKCINQSVADGTSVNEGNGHPFRWMYQGPFSLNTGLYQRFNTFFALAMEFTYDMDNSYKRETFEFNDQYPFSDIRKKINISSRNSIFIKGGMELNPINMFAITLGTGYSYREINIKSDSSLNTVRQKISNNLFLFTFGLHYSFTDKGVISLISIVTYQEIDSTNQQEKSSYGLNLHVKNKIIIPVIGIGYTISI
jgi:hypothetical protein